jgi:signal transduction histidine kinase
MSAQAAVEPRTTSRTPLRNPLRVFVSAEPWLALVFMLSSFVLGLFWFVVLVTLLATGVGTAVTLIGIPILLLTFYMWVIGARLERARVKALLGEEIIEPYRPLPEGTWWQRFKVQVTDRHVWQDLIYLFLLFPVGTAQFVIAVVFVSLPLSFLTVPFWYRGTDDTVVFNQQVTSLPAAIGIAALGIPFLLLLPYVLIGIGRAHAWFARLLLGTSMEELTRRVDELTVRRGQALDSSMSDLRRIERDLHDGAQQRLVKLSMDLGMAKEKLDSDPEAARELINEAHEESKRAMAEIRNLARGIHPAVLTDRGLDAAVSALAASSTVPVTVNSSLFGRLPETVETTAYFIIAEALTNISRHSGATRASVNIRREGSILRIEVVDNGSGGADDTRGTGLRGMRDRASAIDGTLTVESPTGGPTRILVELPCESS